MKIDREKLIHIAIDSRCAICGDFIGYQVWECTEKNGNRNFVHLNCLKSKNIKNQKRQRYEDI